MSRILISILFVVGLSLLNNSNSSSGFDCGHYGHWDLVRNETMFYLFQEWLHNWQQQCDKGFFEGMSLGQGMGSDIIGASNWFEFAIERNNVYRPYHYWQWSNLDVSNCSIPNSKGTIDCYFEPLSTCGLDSNQINLVSNNDRDRLNYLNEAYELFNYLNATDACYLAFKAKRSIQWIHGSFLHYITRPRKDLIPYYQSRVNILNASNDKGGRIIGVHIRGGSPDNRRTIANVSYYIEAIDIIAKELDQVTAVFFCSDQPEKTVVSVEYLTSTFPRPWKYILLEHLTLPSNHHNEAAFALKDDVQHKYSRKQLATEFLSDVDILTKTDAFIGTWSNMYTLVTALRIARGNTRFKKHSCFLHIGVVPPKFLCEGDEEAKMIWKLQTGGRGYSGDEKTGPPNWETN